jgi:hypothetical protein
MKKVFLTLILSILTSTVYAAELTFQETAKWVEKNYPIFTDHTSSLSSDQKTLIRNKISIDEFGNVEVSDNLIEDNKVVGGSKNFFRLSDFKKENGGYRVQGSCSGKAKLGFDLCTFQVILNSEAEKIKYETISEDGQVESDMEFWVEFTVVGEVQARQFLAAFEQLVLKAPASPF